MKNNVKSFPVIDRTSRGKMDTLDGKFFLLKDLHRRGMPSKAVVAKFLYTGSKAGLQDVECTFHTDFLGTVWMNTPNSKETGIREYFRELDSPYGESRQLSYTQLRTIFFALLSIGTYAITHFSNLVRGVRYFNERYKHTARAEIRLEKDMSYYIGLIDEAKSPDEMARALSELAGDTLVFVDMLDADGNVRYQTVFGS